MKYPSVIVAKVLGAITFLFSHFTAPLKTPPFHIPLIIAIHLWAASSSRLSVDLLQSPTSPSPIPNGDAYAIPLLIKAVHSQDCSSLRLSRSHSCATCLWLLHPVNKPTPEFGLNAASTQSTQIQSQGLPLQYSENLFGGRCAQELIG